MINIDYDKNIWDFDYTGYEQVFVVPGWYL